MSEEVYTPGHTHNASEFMARRTLQSHGSFFLPFLSPGLSVLDCGCGPGSITLGIAQCVAPAPVIGIDMGASQIEEATRLLKPPVRMHASKQQAATTCRWPIAASIACLAMRSSNTWLIRCARCANASVS